MGKLFKKVAGFAAPLAGLALGPAGFGLSALTAGGVGAGIGALGGGVKGALSGGLGAYGLAGGGATLGGALSNAGGLGLGNAGQSALGGGLLGAASGGIIGGSKGALLGGAIGGVGGYAQGGGFSNLFGGGATDGTINATDVGKGSVSRLGTTGAVGGAGSSYAIPSSFSTYTDLEDADNILNGIKGVGGTVASSGSTLAGGSSNYLSPLLSAGIGTFTNNKAEDQLLAQQKKSASLLTPFTQQSFNPGDLTQDPGYQFQLQQGQQALDRNQSARGNYFSGEALQAAQDYGQGLAGTTYNDAYGRYLQNQGQKLSAAGALSGVYDNIGNVQAGATTNLGNLISGSGAALLGGTGLNNSGQALNQQYNDPQYLAYLKAMGRA